MNENSQRQRNKKSRPDNDPEAGLFVLGN